MSNDCGDCEIVKSLRRDVDDLKVCTQDMQKDITDMRVINGEKKAELHNFSDMITKIENTMNTLVGKVDVLSEKIAGLNFYTTEEVDKRIKQATDGLKLDELKNEVEDLKMKPAKKFDAIETAIMVGIVSAIIGYVFGKIL